MANHHLKDLNGVPETTGQRAWKQHLSVTVAEGQQAVKKTTY